MKKLLIIRHAKSDQNFFGNDFERPLNERGKIEAPMMALRCKEKQPAIDAFFSSPAKRAKKTAEIFIQAYGKPVEEVIYISALYHAPMEIFYEQIRLLPENVHIAALFAHNPGITQFVNDLAAGVGIDNMPTCGVFAVQVNCDQWTAFIKSKKKFLFFDYPKLLK